MREALMMCLQEPDKEIIHGRDYEIEDRCTGADLL